MRKKIFHQFACSSLILPEHRARLARHHQDRVRERRRRRFAPADEQQLEQFQHLVEQSMHSGRPLQVTFVDSVSGRFHTFTGVAPEQQPEPGRLRFDRGGQMLTVPVTAIVRLEAAFPDSEQS